MFQSELLIESPFPKKKDAGLSLGHEHLDLLTELKCFEESDAICALFLWETSYKNAESALHSMCNSIRRSAYRKCIKIIRRKGKLYLVKTDNLQF